MVLGESGVLAVSSPGFKPLYEPSKRRLTWPNGAIATTYSADEPDQLRGPQHDGAWVDELAAWRYPDAWDMLRFGLRLGSNPRAVITTTPRPTPIIRDLLKQEPTGRVAVTRGSTFDNAANLAATFVAEIRAKYEGTRLGRQELFAEVLDDTPGALWTRSQLEGAWVKSHPNLTRLVVAIDPNASVSEGADEAGIIVCGLGSDKRGYVLDDLSGKLSPDGWARAAVHAYRERKADLIVAEANNGGEMVRHTIHTVDRNANVKLVHASRGKRPRAEPVAALYEQNKISHVGALPRLEDEMCTWAGMSGDQSPNRIDALVWALTEIMLGGTEGGKPIIVGQASRWGDGSRGW